jgi:hypothetical protein
MWNISFSKHISDLLLEFSEKWSAKIISSNISGKYLFIHLSVYSENRSLLLAVIT